MTVSELIKALVDCNPKDIVEVHVVVNDRDVYHVVQGLSSDDIGAVTFLDVDKGLTTVMTVAELRELLANCNPDNIVEVHVVNNADRYLVVQGLTSDDIEAVTFLDGVH